MKIIQKENLPPPILKRNNITFHEIGVAFHFVRENAYSAWRVIGVIVVHPSFQGALYVDDYKYKKYRRAFEKKMRRKSSAYRVGNVDFLNVWRKQFISINDVMAPAIRYYLPTSSKKSNREIFSTLLRKLFIKYALGIQFDARLWRLLAIMLILRKGYVAGINWPYRRFPETVEASLELLEQIHGKASGKQILQLSS